jgi:hypothetical protein
MTTAVVSLPSKSSRIVPTFMQLANDRLWPIVAFGDDFATVRLADARRLTITIRSDGVPVITTAVCLDSGPALDIPRVLAREAADQLAEVVLALYRGAL